MIVVYIYQDLTLAQHQCLVLRENGFQCMMLSASAKGKNCLTDCNPRQVCHGCHHKAMNLINSISFVFGHICGS